MRRPGRGRRAALGAAVAALIVGATACTAHGGGSGTSAGSSASPETRTTIVGTSTVTSTRYLTNGTLTAVPSPSSGPPIGPSSTAVTPSTAASSAAGSSAAGSSAALPAARIGDCPYLTAAAVMSINGQHYGPTSIIPVAPYPICVFTRSDGGYLATTRIIKAASAAAATAAVNAAVPVDASFPVSDPAGWSGGAMTLPHGNADNPENRSIYAVSKGAIAIIAESNQAQSIKGRQMVEQIVANMGW